MGFPENLGDLTRNYPIRKCLVTYNHLSCYEPKNCSAGYVCDEDYLHVKC